MTFGQCLALLVQVCVPAPRMGLHMQRELNRLVEDMNEYRMVCTHSLGCGSRVPQGDTHVEWAYEALQTKELDKSPMRCTAVAKTPQEPFSPTLHFAHWEEGHDCSVKAGRKN